MDHYLYMFTFCITVLLRSQSSDDDNIDRLNRKYTVYGLIGLAVISGSRLLTNNISSLISCWNRANFPSGLNESIPNSINDRLFRILVYFSFK
jgi:hypothetical protein